MKINKIIKPVTAAVLSALLVGCLPFTVDEGELGLVTKYGEIQQQYNSGLHWYNAFTEDTITYSTRENKHTLGNFDERGELTGGVSAYTRDAQTVTTALIITYKITDSVQVYKNYRTTENMISQLLDPRSRQSIEIVFSTYSAQQALENRAKLTNDITQTIRDAVKGYPIEITAVQTVIQFGAEYEKRVEESVQKNIEIQTAERNLIIQQKQAEIARVNAQAAADAKVIEAEAKAKSVRLAGDAEAYAILKKSEALKESHRLVELTQAEKWDGKLPTTMLPNSSVPMINLQNTTGGK